MKPFRKNVALAVDGGGIRGVMVTRALSMLEEELGRPVHAIFRLTGGTSTGAIVAAGAAAGLTAAQMFDLYVQMGPSIFRKSWRTVLFPLTRYRYESEPLKEALLAQIGPITMGDLWKADPRTDVVITTFDLVDNHTRFVKPWKDEYKDWPVYKAVMASSTVPTFFPVFEGRYVDGGVGSYANPCYLTAYEAVYCLGWSPTETTLISLGTGRVPTHLKPEDTVRFHAWQWIEPVLGAFLQSADDQQVYLVRTFFPELDFRRFQVDLRQDIQMDDSSKIPELAAYGEELGRMILNDQVDRSMTIQVPRVR
jgi:patatin-like phospholipase/acyl hydrolase